MRLGLLVEFRADGPNFKVGDEEDSRVPSSQSPEIRTEAMLSGGASPQEVTAKEEKARKMVLMDSAQRLVRRAEADSSHEGDGLGDKFVEAVIKVYWTLQKITKNDERLVREVANAAQMGYEWRAEA